MAVVTPSAPAFPTTDPGPADAAIELVAARTGRVQQTRRLAVPGWVRRLYGPLALVAIWWLVTGLGLVGEETLPTPGQVVSAGRELLRTGELQEHLWASLQRATKGLIIGLLAGVGLATLAGLARRGEEIIDSTMQVLKAIPNFSLVPLLVIWFGIGEMPKVTLVVLSTALPLYINTFGAIRNVDDRLIEAGRTLGLRRRGLLRHVILPGSVPGFLVGLRIALTNMWLALIFAETINARSGLGALMSDARSWFRVDIMVLIVVIYAILGLLSYALVLFLERRLLAWRRGFKGVS